MPAGCGPTWKVWVGDKSDQDWMVGGSFLIARRVRMLIESWDNTSLFEQDPTTQFIPVHAAPCVDDLLNEYIKHNGTGIYAVPPGLEEVGDWYGRRFL